MNQKKSFTLLEIIIVIFIISSVYYLVATNFITINNKQSETPLLLNVKELLKGYQFDEKIELKCVEDNYRCFILADGIVVKELDRKLFKVKPDVYRYDTKLDIIDYGYLELDKLESFPIIFEYSIDKYNKTKDMIVQVEEQIYIFNSIHEKPILKEYLSDVNDYFEDKISEVKDAF